MTSPGNSNCRRSGLVHLKGLTGLRGLALYGTRVTDAGLAHLGGLTRLGWLSIFDTQVSEAGFVHLTDLPRLRMLFLYGIAVGPVGLDCLKRMTRLKNLYVTDGLLSEADERLLVESLPGLKVHRGWLMASDVPRPG